MLRCAASYRCHVLLAAGLSIKFPEPTAQPRTSLASSTKQRLFLTPHIRHHRTPQNFSESRYQLVKRLHRHIDSAGLVGNAA